MQVSIPELEDHIERVVEEKLAAALDARASEDDPWLGSKAAADYMGVSVQRIHDLVCAGLLPRYGERGERLYFRRTELDQYMQSRAAVRVAFGKCLPKMSGNNRNAPAALQGSGAGQEE